MRGLLVIALCLLGPGAAIASDDDSRENPTANLEGYVFNFGTGYGVPFGSILKGSNGAKLSDGISGQIPIMVGLGFRSDPIFAIGLAFTYAPGLPKGCGSASPCSASDMVIEGEIRFHLPSESKFSGWFSAGVGYEWLSLAYNALNATAKGLLFEFQLGGDYRVASPLTIGPFIGVRFGKYGSLEASDGGRSGSADIPDMNKAWHGWVLFGLRGELTS